VTSTAPCGTTIPVHLIRSASGKATEEIAEEIVRLHTLSPQLGIAVGRLAMDGDSVFVRFLRQIWETMRSQAGGICTRTSRDSDCGGGLKIRGC
jgi:hypothetical protein